MNLSRRAFARQAALSGAVAVSGGMLAATPAAAKTARVIDAEVRDALDELFITIQGSQALYQRSAGVLIMPEILEAGFFVGGAYGEGALLVGGVTNSYWSYGSASIGFQLGAQSTRHALFFLTEGALRQFLRDDGFELGVGAGVTILDQGAAADLNTVVGASEILAIEYSRQGLLGGATLRGGKYTLLVR